MTGRSRCRREQSCWTCADRCDPWSPVGWRAGAFLSSARRLVSGARSDSSTSIRPSAPQLTIVLARLNIAELTIGMATHLSDHPRPVQHDRRESRSLKVVNGRGQALGIIQEEPQSRVAPAAQCAAHLAAARRHRTRSRGPAGRRSGVARARPPDSPIPERWAPPAPAAAAGPTAAMSRRNSATKTTSPALRSPSGTVTMHRLSPTARPRQRRPFKACAGPLQAVSQTNA
jgi:hypothetical protein